MDPALSTRQKPKKQLFTVSQAADFLGVSAKTLRRWDQKRILSSLRTTGGQRRYHKDLLHKFKTQQQLTRVFVREYPISNMTTQSPMVPSKSKLLTFKSLILPIILFVFLLLTTCLYFF
ncbi:MAG TPA: MerR family DNA-binding transcriptional regulator [Candidatus Bathyarchaeia archaeon]|nr:MerR family DNA-binding transcriptional regulator [Candidatus Bathyarchaeia archaeon]